MLEAIKTGTSILNESTTFIDQLLSKIEKYKTIKQDTTTFLRVLYLEVVGNLEVLQTINFSEFDSVTVNHPKLQSLLRMLHTDVAEGVFYKEQAAPNLQLYEKLRKQGQVKNRNQSLLAMVNGVERNSDKRFIYENILQAISFVVLKVELLRKLNGLKDEELSIVRSMKVKVRLININQRLLMIKSVMDKMEEIKEMAR
ncbi:MAG TPA: hypothetical protein VMV56_11450 [Williamwhitmania sp.]|nr:hypothetical protein [Williamwhitmania sp.]